MADHVDAHDVVLLRFGGDPVARALADLPVHELARDAGSDTAGAIDAAVRTARRVVVAGTDADLAAVLTRLLRTERLDIEVAQAGATLAGRARTGPAQRVPLIRDETGQVIVGSAVWLPTAGSTALHGEAVVDDTVLFDGEVPAVLIEPTLSLPGLRARVRTRFTRRWTTGRAAQLGTTGARLIRDGVEAPREVRRSTFYRNTEGWLRV